MIRYNTYPSRELPSGTVASDWSDEGHCDLTRFFDQVCVAITQRVSPSESGFMGRLATEENQEAW